MNLATQAAEQRSALEQTVATALAMAQGRAEHIDITIQKTTGISVSTRHAKAENVEFNSDGALAIIAYQQHRQGIATSNDLSEPAIARTLQAAINIARHTSPDPCSAPADPELMAYTAPDLDLFHPQSLTPEQAIEQAAIAEQTALQADPRIINTEGGNFTSHHTTRVFGNSHGMLQSYSASRYSLSACVIAGQNGDMERDYAWTTARALADLHPPKWIGEQCARRALARLAPRKLTTRQAPVIFSAELAPGLFGHLAAALSGHAVYRQSTFLLNDLHQQIFPPWLNISEQPHIPKGLASAPFDNEGIATRPAHIIRQGVLQQWLLNSYAARKLGLKSTGHAGGIHNWRITHSGLTLPALLAQMGTGLLITEIMGQGVNITTGDYSRGISGFWIENGQIQYPVSEITIAGNLRQIWQNILAIASDTEQRGNIHCGSVLISNMQIAGQ